MPLPKTKHPIHKITVPSTGKKYNFRQFLSGEEKILLTAQASGDPGDVITAIEQVINICALDEDFDVNQLTTFDFDYVFIRLRAISVDNTVQVKYTDPDTDEEHTFVINLDDITVDMPDVSKKVVNQDKVTIILKYPTMHEMLAIIDNIKNPTEGMLSYLDQLLVRGVDKIYNEEEQFEFNDQELLEFLNDQTIEVSSDIKQFFNNIPDVSYTINFESGEGEPKQLVLKGIDDFFTF